MYVSIPVKVAYFILGSASTLIFIFITCCIIVSNESRKREEKIKNLLELLSNEQKDDKGDE